MDYEELGKSITEALAIKQLMIPIQKKISEIEAMIAGNSREIEKRKGLESINEKLEQDKAELINKLAAQQADLDKRMKVLNKSGVELPVNVLGGGFVRT